MNDPRAELIGAIDDFVEHIRTKKRQAPSTISGYVQSVKRLLSFIQTDAGGKLTGWAQVDHPVAQCFIEHLLAEAKAIRSVNLNITSLRMFFDFLVLRGVTPSNPFYEIEFKNPPLFRPVSLTDQNIRKLIAAPSTYLSDTLESDPPNDAFARAFLDYMAIRDEAIIRLLFFTGLKTGEIVSLRDEHIDFEKKTLNVFSGSKSRCIFLVPEITVLLVKGISCKKRIIWYEYRSLR
jgi:site-specific recombinase XerD